jgi:cytoskeletal protein RodZ
MTNPFKKQEIIRQKTVGERLQSAREEHKLSILEAARQTKISSVHIAALEYGRYNELPSPVYIRNYLKVYSGLLGIPWETIEPVYRKEVAVYRGAPKASHEEKQQVIVKKRLKSTADKIHVAQTRVHQPAILVPQLLKYGTLALLLLSIVLYITVQIVRIYNPPSLELIQPAADVSVTKNPLTIEGRTAPESIVQINGQETNVDTDGSFSTEVFLQEGLNTIRVTARSKRSREREIVRYVLFSRPKEVK